MIVVSDTTPINYFVLIEQIELLPRLYGQVVVPVEVVHELRHRRTPAPVRAWAKRPPSWLDIREVNAPGRSASALDAGELAAITLAESLHADIVLMDDRKGRVEAARRNLRVVGTLGVLAEAAGQQLIDLHQILEQLRQTTFHISPDVLQSLIERLNKPR